MRPFLVPPLPPEPAAPDLAIIAPGELDEAMTAWVDSSTTAELLDVIERKCRSANALEGVLLALLADDILLKRPNIFHEIVDLRKAMLRRVVGLD